MAATLSSFSVPSFGLPTPCRVSSFNPLTLTLWNTESCRLLRNSRNLNSVKAMVLKDRKKNKKDAIPDSLLHLRHIDEESEVCAAESSSGSVDKKSSFPESVVIKLEQSVNIFLVESVVKILDALYQDRAYARFYVLETIARVPYFAFMSVLHMYESFGWWRRGDYLKVHFAESWNEMHHLLIMEELGGNSWWFDRFLAQHIALFYYMMTAFMYLLSPRMAYHFSECVEMHAYDTYDKFLQEKGDELKSLPASEVALKYYTNEDLYLFDEFQTSQPPNSRRPKIENLYDVFVNIRDDEDEHCKTMRACQTHRNLRSPHSAATFPEESGCAVSSKDCEGIFDCLKKSISSPQRKQ